jgi:hypothetical protein
MKLMECGPESEWVLLVECDVNCVDDAGDVDKESDIDVVDEALMVMVPVPDGVGESTSGRGDEYDLDDIENACLLGDMGDTHGAQRQSRMERKGKTESCMPNADRTSSSNGLGLNVNIDVHPGTFR